MPKDREKLLSNARGPGILSVQMPGGVPGGMVKVGIERDISPPSKQARCNDGKLCAISLEFNSFRLTDDHSSL